MTTAGKPRDGVRREIGAARADAGNAMVVALLVLVVLTSASVAYIAITKSEKQIAGNAMSSSQALYAAESGITEGLRRMGSQSDSVNYIGPPGAAVPGWGFSRVCPRRALITALLPELNSPTTTNKKSSSSCWMD